MNSRLMIIIFSFFVSGLFGQSYSVLRENARNLEKNGNFKEALKIYEQLIEKDTENIENSNDDLHRAVNCQNRMRVQEEFDSLIDKFLKVRSDDWQAYETAGNFYINRAYHNGRLVNGEFKRGYNSRYRGVHVNSTDYDRSKSIQLFEKGLKLLPKDYNKASFYSNFSSAIYWNRSHRQAYLLQDLTDSTTLPDLSQPQYHGYRYNSGSNAPVDEEGNPIYHSIPESYETAKTDGERWRWLLKKAADNGGKENSLWIYADFLFGQFGVQTLHEYSWYFNQDQKDNTESILALDKLKDNETIAKLAGGIKKFTMPDEHNYLQILKELGEMKNISGLNRLGTIYLNRRQYVKSVAIWKQIMDIRPNDKNAQRQLKQITGNWGEFVNVKATVDGVKPEFDFRFRNATKVSFRATRINMKKLINDTIAYVKTKPDKLDWNKVNLYNIGYQILKENKKQYLTPEVEAWTVDLNPAANHFNRRITLTAPFSRAGHWLLESEVEDGNTSNCMTSISSIAIVKNSLTNKSHYYIADSETGAPMADTEVKFFGYYQKYLGRDGKKNKYEIQYREFTKKTNAQGQVYLSNAEVRDGNNYFRWMITVDKNDQFSHWGFVNIYANGGGYQKIHDQGFRSYIVTDRPVYKPGQKVEFKAWTANSSYDSRKHQSLQGNQLVRIFDPKGKEILKTTLECDEWGGISGNFNLQANATLGNYSINTNHGSFSFRVEEYKKPEFSVTVLAPDKPVALGEKMPVTVKAKYYFGAPVTKGSVKIKVHRNDYHNSWYPIEPWDWFYGSGYGWCGVDYEWYPGWGRWGCKGPRPSWIPWYQPPPELVMEMEAEVDANGEVKFVIDSSVAKALYGDKSHKYSITVEVTDESRRTIVGSGDVIATAEPFKVFVWSDRAYYQTGQPINISFLGRTASGNTVKGKAELKLFKITYDKDGKASEELIDQTAVDTGDEEENSWKLNSSKAGQYRVSCVIKTEEGVSQEGAVVFSVFGKDTDTEGFRFNKLELLTDQKTYQPGETVKLRINTDRNNSTVLLFIRPGNGVYPEPKILKMDGKSANVEIQVEVDDQPNFFVEAFTISDGQVHTSTKQIYVPPSDKLIKVAIKPDRDDYRPGQKAKYNLTLTDSEGNPVKGTFCMSVYDQSLDYIAGPTSQQPIREFFWSWKRNHYPSIQHNVFNYFNLIIIDHKQRMQQLGIFGNVGEELAEGAAEKKNESGRAVRKSANAMALESDALMDKGFAAPAATAELQQGKQQGGNSPDVKVRKDFADTAFWSARVDTNSKGEASVTFNMPENLTAWKTRCWGVGNGFKVGESENIVTTSKKIILRLQAPRFFVENDVVTISANVHNYLKTNQKIRVKLESNSLLQALDGLEKEITIQAGGEQRVDWNMKVVGSGEVVLKAYALTKEESDAVQMKFPAKVHGILKTDSFSGFIARHKNGSMIEFTIPEKIDPEYTMLEVRYSPSLALSMVSALPYLTNFPYGCTEQTLNRFLPTTITMKVLKDMNMNLEQIREQLTNLNAQETGNDLHRLQQWKKLKNYQKHKNPVFDTALVEQMQANGVKDLIEMQLSDGGWGWFSGYGERSSAHTTAYVVNGLLTARSNGVDIPQNVIQRGLNWLKEYQEHEALKIRNHRKDIKEVPRKAHPDNLDAFVFMVLANAEQKNNEEMAGYLYEDRNHFSIYGKAMIALAFHKLKDNEKVSMLRRNIEQYLVVDKENQTAYLKMDNGSYWWYWYGSEWETHAYYLKLLAKVDAKSEVASGLVKYLVNNRKNSYYWNSTRDTALCIEAIADYITATKESNPDMTVEILLDGEKIGEEKITVDNLFTFNNKVIVDSSKVSTGKHKLELRRKGDGPVYFNAYMTYFSKMDFIKKAGLEVKVQRKIYKLIRKKDVNLRAGATGKVVNANQEAYERILLKNGDELTSGDLIEVELEIDSKNDYEYIVFEDLKAAGFEAVDVRSGYTRKGFHAYREMRNDRVSFFATTLPRGKHNISYRLRAEIPGKFSALPAKVYANYAPELKGNSDEIKLTIKDK